MDRLPTPVFMGFPGGSDDEESTFNTGDLGLIPGLGRSPGGGHGTPLQYSCLENSHGQRNLVGYSPWGHKESDATERLSTRVLCTYSTSTWVPYNKDVCVCMLCSVYLTLCDPMTVVHQAPLSMGILQARILEWVAMLSSRGSSRPRDWTQVSHIAGRFFTIWATRDMSLTKLQEIVKNRENCPWGCEESEMTEWLNKNNKINRKIYKGKYLVEKLG